MVDSHSFVNMFFVFAAVLQISSLVHCLPVQSGDLDEAAAYSELGWELSQKHAGDMSKRSFDTLGYSSAGDSSAGRRQRNNLRLAIWNAVAKISSAELRILSRISG
ncbi:hypothetical protein V1264_007280 [Littorina saxatilis]|uniref:Uncharacterized protein n=1 Tax=Littorina saxatilis TaxID=31220 RepID=A0AAN9AV07_9CAEN